MHEIALYDSTLLSFVLHKQFLFLKHMLNTFVTYPNFLKWRRISPINFFHQFCICIHRTEWKYSVCTKFDAFYDV